MSKRNSNLIIYGLCLLWCGVLLGVSFIAAPAKFLVAELGIITAVKVGRATFKVYHYFEIFIVTIVALILFLHRVEKTIWAYFTLLSLVLAIQYFLVQPMVEVNSDRLFAGIENQTKSHAHLYYILCDCLKVIFLLGFLPAISFINRSTKK